MKSILKIMGIIVGAFVLLLVFLVAKNFFDARKPILDDDYYLSFSSGARLEEKYSRRGDFKVAFTMFETENKAAKKIRVWYPEDLKNDHGKYPLILVVNGSNTPALKYEPFFSRLASWGFFVVGNDDLHTGTGESTSFTLDYILSQTEAGLFQGKIDKEHIGIIGYSQGGAGAIRAVTRFENGKMFTAMFTGSAAYSLLAKNMGWEYDVSAINIPYFMTAGTGKSDDSGSDPETSFGGVAPLSSLVQNYESMSDNVQKVRARVVGAEHTEILTKTDGYMTAWMLYQLRNDEEAAKVFVADDAEIINNSNWQDVKKQL